MRKFAQDPLPEQVQQAPAPIQLLPEQDEWEIEGILSSRVY